MCLAQGDSETVFLVFDSPAMPASSATTTTAVVAYRNITTCSAGSKMFKQIRHYSFVSDKHHDGMSGLDIGCRHLCFLGILFRALSPEAPDAQRVSGRRGVVS